MSIWLLEIYDLTIRLLYLIKNPAFTKYILILIIFFICFFFVPSKHQYDWVILKNSANLIDLIKYIIIISLRIEGIIEKSLTA